MAFQQFPAKGGIPSGTTSARPSSPVSGDTYYDGDLGFLLIWDGTKWLPCSAPAAQPTIAVTDVGTGRAWNNPAGTVVFTEGVSGGKAAGFTALQGSFSNTATTSTIVLGITGNAGSYSFTGTAYNGFGTSPQAVSQTETLTTVPDAPTSVTVAGVGYTTSDVTVSWTAPSTGGKTISLYTVTPYLGATAQTTRTTTGTSVTVSGLTQGSAYTFKVKAANANGTGVDSTASGSFTIPTFINVDYLVVAGGGSGGANYVGGGGGAGGYKTTIGGSPATIATNNAVGITVGAGGAQRSGTNAGNNGNNSVFGTVTSTGGGGGGANTINGSAGGSGGGAGSPMNSTPPGTSTYGAASPSGQGNRGGYGYDGVALVTVAGGGGGAGAVGGDAVQALNSNAGAGGVGLANTITGSSVYYAGGGGGGHDRGGSASYTGNGGTGGNGGGGNGGTWNITLATVGGTNTGGGGGGSSFNTGYPTYNTGAAGGSGVIILKIPNTYSASFSGGVSQTMSTAVSGYKVYTITAAGVSDTVTFS